MNATQSILSQVVIKRTGKLANVLQATILDGRIVMAEIAIDRTTSTWYYAKEIQKVID